MPIVVSLVNAKSIVEHTECYANNSDPYLLFATKTSYFTVDNEEAVPIQVEGKKHLIILKISRVAIRKMPLTFLGIRFQRNERI